MTIRDAAILVGTGLALVVLAFALSASLGAVARRWGPRVGLVDFPGGPLRHRVPVSLGGGVAIWLSTITMLGLGALVLGLGRPYLPEAVTRYADGLWYRSGELAVIIGLATVVMFGGLISDMVGQSSWQSRLAAQVLPAVLLAAAGIRVTLFRPFEDPFVGGLVTVVWVIGLTNAFIFLDNMDGLAAGVGLIASLLFAASQIPVGSLFAPAVLLVLAGVLAGFLLHNRYPARLFMGESGSGFLGFLLGAMTVAGTYYRYGHDDSPCSVLAPVLVMIVPLYEAASVFLFSFGERNDPFTRNRRHFSYRLLESGLTPTQAVRAILLVSLGAGLGAPLLHRLAPIEALLIVGQSACLMGVVALLEMSAFRREGADTKTRPSAPLPTDRTPSTDDLPGAA